MFLWTADNKSQSVDWNLVNGLKEKGGTEAEAEKQTSVGDDDDDDWCFTATFVHVVGEMGRATSEGNETKYVSR